MNNKICILIYSLILLSGCSSQELNEAFWGLKSKPYIEPEQGETATLKISAPKLRSQWGFHDKAEVFLYNTCSDKLRLRGEGYIGGFILSSKTTEMKSKSIKISTGEPLFVDVGYENNGGLQCMNKFKIQPKTGKEYHLEWMYDYSVARCNIKETTISDKNTTMTSDEITYIKNIKRIEGLGWGSCGSQK